MRRCPLFHNLFASQNRSIAYRDVSATLIYRFPVTCQSDTFIIDSRRLFCHCFRNDQCLFYLLFTLYWPTLTYAQPVDLESFLLQKCAAVPSQTGGQFVVLSASILIYKREIKMKSQPASCTPGRCKCRFINNSH